MESQQTKIPGYMNEEGQTCDKIKSESVPKIKIPNTQGTWTKSVHKQKQQANYKDEHREGFCKELVWKHVLITSNNNDNGR